MAERLSRLFDNSMGYAEQASSCVAVLSLADVADAYKDNIETFENNMLTSRKHSLPPLLTARCTLANLRQPLP